VINNRGFDEGDFGTPERDYDNAASESKGFERMTEACQSVGMESWGYKKDEDYYTDRHLIASIDKYLARDANYLLNVGPTGDGSIPAQSAEILKRIGLWKKSVDESFTDVEPGFELVNSPGALSTKRDKTLYVHLNRLPVGNGIKLKPITVAPQKATLLNTNKKVDYTVNLSPSDHASQQPYLRLRNLPVETMCNSVMVVKLEFDRPLNEISKIEKQLEDVELKK
jgi:alpha-L-fucosidase